MVCVVLDGSVMIVVVRECIVVSGSDSPPCLLLGWAVFQYYIVSLELNGRIYRVCVLVLEAFFLACAEFWKTVE